MIFEFINLIVINVSLIISSIFLFYFTAIYISMKNEQETKFSFAPESPRLVLSTRVKIILGVLVGCLGILISFNGISISGEFYIDVRYLPVYFSIIYGAPMIGGIAAIIIMMFKNIQFFLLDTPLINYIDNTLFIFIILLISWSIYNRHLTLRQSGIIYLSYSLMTRFFILFFIYYPAWTNNMIINVTIYIFLYTLLFLITSIILDNIINMFKKVISYKERSTFDLLTNLYNKHVFSLFLENFYTQAMHQRSFFSLAIIDGDEFKEINDHYGHLFGDDILVHLGKAINSVTNNSNILGFRIGGDEFAILFDDTIVSPIKYCQTIQLYLKNHPLIIEENEIKLTLSIGIITVEQTSPADNIQKSYQDIFELADKEMYIAKAKGRDTIQHSFIAN
ncbi:GGDEF domain-containing protein [Vagococcus vulneris]|uniref:GGDEF domain-containing protein n=1 Tax=Vagococcus vulneris TaxID=1977869 RepID=A0A429ZX02_9ENTE|nr:GGDEF domain-containing protein [Vagococcus vulneris]RST98384.1 hypothetical protein CBF37_07675 [Vagococcus vulneris]